MKIKQLWKFVRSVWSIYRKAIKDQDLWEFMCGPEYLPVLAAREYQYRIMFKAEPPREFSAHSPRVREQMTRLATQLGACGIAEIKAVAVAKGVQYQLGEVGVFDLDPIIYPIVSAVARGYMKKDEARTVMQHLPQLRPSMRDYYGVDVLQNDRIETDMILRWIAI